MTSGASVFYLKVQKVEQSCLFELSWGRGQQLSVTVPYPETLSVLYQNWKSVYLSFYKSAFRGRVVDDGAGYIPSAPIDWHAQLVQAEAKLLYEFHQWLRLGELFEIRSCIARAAVEQGRGQGEEHQKTPLFVVDVFLICNPLELARLPWEAWELGSEFATTGRIRFFRTPPMIQGVTATLEHRRFQPRILAILGDETGLNLQEDRAALRSLASIADIQFVGWQPGKDIEPLKGEIVKTIADEQGWDVLLFAGHSNEAALVGGELAIAPGVSLFLKEIAESLKIAKQRGLQFALFNSCNGLDLANALIDLGLSQVAVMREPIHNQVAQAFLLRFLQSLAEYKDVHESLSAACQDLKREKHLTYPSAYLIPSLFRHPDAPLFRLKRRDSWQWLKRWLPTKQEAIAVGALALISCSLSVQNFLLERRVLAQAIYRNWTGQIAKTTAPPLLLIQIDDQSIVDAKIKDPTPMDRKYLAKLVDHLLEVRAKVVGIDYLLDRPHADSNNSQEISSDRILAQSVQNAVQQQQTWFVFAASKDDAEQWVGALPEIASMNWSLQGNLNLFTWQGRLGYMKLVPDKDASSRNLPLAYLLALASHLNFTPTDSPPQPQLQPSKKDFITQLTGYLSNKQKQDYRTLFSSQSYLHPITSISYGLRQIWLHPIIDFSIPPDQVYELIPAWKFLQITADSPQLKHLNRQAVMIAPGGYGDDPGVKVGSEDVFPIPTAVSYWRSRQNQPDPRRIFTGGEAHAYMFHHFLNRRFVVPIPDLWMIGVAAVLGKGIVLTLQQRRQQSKLWGGVLLISMTTAYGFISWQTYIGASVLLPWFLPSVTFGVYSLPLVLRKKYYA